MGTEGHKPVLTADYFHKPSPARMWNYLQGGKDNYPLDRDAGKAMVAAYPDMADLATQCRHFLTRAIRFVTGEAGVRQYLDLGCGMPVPAGLSNVHEVAQGIDPAARVVYVDSDPVVMAHARALLAPVTGQGRCAYIEADARDTEPILTEAAQTLDFTEPVGVIMCGLLGAVEFDQALGIPRRVLAVLAPGSYLLFDDGVVLSQRRRESVHRRNESGMTNSYHLRTPEQIGRYFAGLELIEPGLVSVTEWRPDPVEVGKFRPVETYGAVLRTR